MPLTGETLTKLRGLLKECSAQLVGADESRGTGFFIDERILLTCAHVVKGPKGTEVEVRPFGRAPRKGIVREVQTENAVDLAVVEVEPVAGEEPQPAVVLDRAMADGITYYAVGYPKQELLNDTGLEEIGYRGHRRMPDGASVTLLILEAGQAAVTRGLSGGAVLNPVTGAVVALVQYSEDTKSDAGGGAIPIARAADTFSEVASCLNEPPISARRWRDDLGQDEYQALGKTWGWRRTIDVVVGGDRSRWQVKIDPDDEDPQEITVKDLPDEVSKALFHWAQRRRVRGEGDVKLLGRLLASAVFPTNVSSRIVRDRLADELLVRLRVDASSDLFDVPWELVTVPSAEGDVHLAAERGMSLVHVAPHPQGDKVTTAPSQGEAHVLGIVVQPTEWQDRMPTLRDGEKKVEWPISGQVMDRLRTAVNDANRFRFDSVDDPTPSAIDKAVTGTLPQGASFEVVHYIGFGQFEDGKAKIALSDEEGDVEWREASDLFGWVAKSNARLFVAEFALPPFGSEPEPVPASIFPSALKNRVNAVVFTRFPVHPRQFNTFNVALYRSLGGGESVEAAVQEARGEVKENRFLGDAAGFGWFTLVTGPLADTRLVTPAASGPFATGAKQEPSASEGEGETSQQPQQHATFDRGGS